MSRSDSNPPDPVYVHSRREAALILLIWAASLAWTVGYCWMNGYEQASPPLVLGMPRWVFWGVLAPWVVAAAASVVFAHRVMILDDLGENEEEPEKMTHDE